MSHVSSYTLIQDITGSIWSQWLSTYIYINSGQQSLVSHNAVDDYMVLWAEGVDPQTPTSLELILRQWLVKGNEEFIRGLGKRGIGYACWRCGVSRKIILRCLFTLDRTAQDFYHLRRTQLMEAFAKLVPADGPLSQIQGQSSHRYLRLAVGRCGVQAGSCVCRNGDRSGVPVFSVVNLTLVLARLEIAALLYRERQSTSAERRAAKSVIRYFS